MTDLAANSQVCAAVFSALVVALKESGLKVEDHASDKDFDPDERIVMAYLRLCAKLRTESNAQRPNVESNAEDPPDSILDDVESVGGKVETEGPSDKDSTHGPELSFETVSQPDAPSEEGKLVIAKELNALGPDEDTVDEPQTQYQGNLPNPPVYLEPPLLGLLANGDHLNNRPVLRGSSEKEAPSGAEPEPDTLSSAEDTGKSKGISGIPKVGPRPFTPPERVSLPNARTKKPYEARIEGYTNLRMRDDAGSGLILGKDGLVSAEAIQAGEYKIKMIGIKNERSVSILVRLSVIAHPKDLWESIPSDQNAPHAKPDEAFEKVEAEALMVAASKRGRSHAKGGGYRDDHFGLSYNESSGWYVMVVADGAGSARLSREGSRMVCSVVLSELEEILPERVDPEAQAMVHKILKAESEEERRSNAVLAPVVNSLMHAAREAAHKLERHAEQLNCNVADLSTTLAIATAKKVGDRWLLLSFSIGDGGVGVWDAEAGEVALMCKPDSGEFAGQTRFLSLDELGLEAGCTSRVFAEVRSDFSAFLAMTDGITDPKFETDSELANPERWRAFWNGDLTKEVVFSRNNNALKEQFLDWMDFWSRGNHDDRTLAVLVPKDVGLSEEGGSTKA